MATANPYTLVGPAGVRLYGGRFPAALLSGTAAPLAATASGVLSTAPPALIVGAQIATLSVYNESGSGARPFTATVLPRRGQVPSGSKVSNATGTEAGAILSTHDDGSAAVVVFASTATATGTMALHVATGTVSPALTAAAISAHVSSVAVDLGSYGVASVTDFSTPERVWWATSKTICARYRVAAPTPGSTALEAVIDIHAWADRALVEVVVENSKMTTATPTAPTAASYTAAQVTVNGTPVGSPINGNGAPEGAHSRFRAVYAPAWVGAGATGLCVQQLHTELQLHPLLFKCDQTATFDMSGYAADAYTPWSTGRHRASSMGGAGDHASIGPLPQWESRALQSGDYRAWKATEASALALLGYTINYRDTATGLPPTFTQLAGKSMQSNWPSLAYDGAMGFEVAHHPAAGLMAFIGRPSPVFIELAQKISVTVGTWSTFQGAQTGVFGGPYQVRGRAWCMRSLAHATFLTPDGHSWKAPAKTSMEQNVTFMDGWRTDAKYVLGVMCDDTVAAPADHDGAVAGFQQNVWQHHYLVTELHKVASARLLTGAAQTALNTLADWAAMQPVRWVNEQANGGWRYVAYKVSLGDNASTINSLATWGLERARAGNHSDAPPAVSGTWFYNGGTPTSYASYTSDAANVGFYPAYFWSALCAAVERGVSGAATAWATVAANITNLSAWRAAGFANDPRWGTVPKNPPGFASGADAGSYNSTTDVLTVARTGDTVNAASWALAPTGRWFKVANTRGDSLDAMIKAAIPAWQELSDWDRYFASWSGMAPDLARSRVFFSGGGHNDGSNNGLYSFNFYRMAWDIEMLPSDQTRWPNTPEPNTGITYRNAVSTGQSFSYCAESHYATEARITAGTLNPINDWGLDEIYWDNPTISGEPGLGKPGSKHTYHTYVYVPGEDAVVIVHRRLWKISLATDAVVYKRHLNDNPGTLTGGGSFRTAILDTEHGLTVYDEVTNEVLSSSSGSSGVNNRVSFDLDTSTWALNPANYNPPWGNWDNVANTRVGRNIIVVVPPRSSGSNAAGNAWVYSLNSRSVIASSTGFQYAGGLSAASFASELAYYDGASLEYIAPLGVYWMWHKRAADDVLLPVQIDPSTTPWTMSPLVFSGAVPTPHKNLLRKMIFVPEMNAVWLYDRGTLDWYVYKL